MDEKDRAFEAKDTTALVEIVPPPLQHDNPRIDEVDDFKGYAGVATLALTPEKAAKLRATLPDVDHDILPTGEVYVTQVHYRRLLTDTFGPGAWALVPRGGFSVSDNTMMREYALVIEGRFISEAVGESEYQPANPRMSYASTAEAVKSNALMRCCKDLGIASECWDRQWTERWKEAFAVEVWRKGSQKPQWRRRDAKPFYDEKGPVTGAGEGAPPPRARQEGPAGEPRGNAPAQAGKRPLAATALDGEILDLADGLCALPGVTLTPSEAISRASAFFGRKHERTGQDMTSQERWETDVPLGLEVVSFTNPGTQSSEKWKKGTAAKLRDRIASLESGDMGDEFVNATEGGEIE